MESFTSVTETMLQLCNPKDHHSTTKDCDQPWLGECILTVIENGVDMD